MNRRKFINVGGLAATALLAAPQLLAATQKAKIKAVAFDAFTIFNPQSVFDLAEILFKEKGAELSSTWRTKQFEYTWLRTAGGHYKNFWEVTRDTLFFAAKKAGINLSDDDGKLLMQKYLSLTAWPDVVPALKALKEKEIRPILLSNLTPGMLNGCVETAGLNSYFEQVLSTDLAKTFKPAPAAYQMAIDILKLKKEEIAYASFTAWDTAGAKWFGYPTFWVNRLNVPGEELNATPDGMGTGLDELVNFVS